MRQNDKGNKFVLKTHRLESLDDECVTEFSFCSGCYRTLASELEFLQRQEVRQKARISGLERDLTK